MIYFSRLIHMRPEIQAMRHKRQILAHMKRRKSEIDTLTILNQSAPSDQWRQRLDRANFYYEKYESRLVELETPKGGSTSIRKKKR